MVVRVVVALAGIAAGIAADVAAAPAQAGTYSYTTIGPPGASVFPRAINDAGVIVGELITADRMTFGFALRDGVLTLVQKNGVYTQLLAINQAGIAVGQFSDASPIVYNTGNGAIHQFFGVFPTGISHDEILGYAEGTGSAGVLAGATVATLIPPGFASSDPVAINNRDEVLGTSGNTGFVYQNGGYTVIPAPFPDAVPSFSQVAFTGLGETGAVVGYASRRLGRNSRKPVSVGFVYQDGAFETVRVPGALYTFPAAVLGHRVVAGTYSGPSVGRFGFLKMGGHYSTIRFPGSSTTDVIGMNRDGTLIGTCYDAGGQFRAFVATCAPDQRPCTQ